MSSDITTRQSKKIRILIATGAAVVLAGLVLHWNAKPLARKPVSPNVSTIDESYKERIQHLGDNIFWVGLALIVVGSFAWVNQTEEKQ
jgi:dipeptide/tripeptide permease